MKGHTVTRLYLQKSATSGFRTRDPNTYGLQSVRPLYS